MDGSITKKAEEIHEVYRVVREVANPIIPPDVDQHLTYEIVGPGIVVRGFHLSDEEAKRLERALNLAFTQGYITRKMEDQPEPEPEPTVPDEFLRAVTECGMYPVLTNKSHVEGDDGCIYDLCSLRVGGTPDDMSGFKAWLMRRATENKRVWMRKYYHGPTWDGVIMPYIVLAVEGWNGIDK
jgi:hypothetical protein